MKLVNYRSYFFFQRIFHLILKEGGVALYSERTVDDFSIFRRTWHSASSKDKSLSRIAKGLDNKPL
jgi:hypothetical protein